MNLTSITTTLTAVAACLLCILSSSSALACVDAGPYLEFQPERVADCLKLRFDSDQDTKGVNVRNECSSTATMRSVDCESCVDEITVGVNQSGYLALWAESDGASRTILWSLEEARENGASEGDVDVVERYRGCSHDEGCAAVSSSRTPPTAVWLFLALIAIRRRAELRVTT